MHFLYFQGQFLKEKATFPAPFQWVYYIAYFIRQYKTKGKEERTSEKQKEKSKLCKEYLKLLKNLIEIQQHNKLESTDEDRLADLRKDMKLDMEQMIAAKSHKKSED